MSAVHIDLTVPEKNFQRARRAKEDVHTNSIILPEIRESSGLPEGVDKRALYIVSSTERRGVLMHRVIAISILVTTSSLISGCGSWFYTGQHPSVDYHRMQDHMPEDIRARIASVVVVADPTRPSLEVCGDYGEYVPTVGEGTAGGAAAGVKMTGAMVAQDPRAIFLLPFILPAAIVAGGIGGAAGAKIEKELAEFREGLADDIVDVGDRPVPSDRLATQLRSYLSLVTEIEAATENADAVLTVSVSHVAVDTDNEDATITTYANGSLSDNADQALLYSKEYQYSERDKLRNWTANENEAWTAYVERARHYIAAEVTADMFETIHVRNVLRPVKTDSFTGGWSGRAKSHQPTLSWELFLLGGDPYEFEVHEDEIRFDLRIFEGSRLVYEARRIEGTSHTLEVPLPNCKDLRWSVRPVYRVEGRIRAGDWMQYRSGFDKFWNNEAVRSDLVAPEFWQYFPELDARCSS